MTCIWYNLRIIIIPSLYKNFLMLYRFISECKRNDEAHFFLARYNLSYIFFCGLSITTTCGECVNTVCVVVRFLQEICTMPWTISSYFGIPSRASRKAVVLNLCLERRRSGLLPLWFYRRKSEASVYILTSGYLLYCSSTTARVCIAEVHVTIQIATAPMNSP